MKSQLLNQPMQDVINENVFKTWLLFIFIVLFFISCIYVSFLLAKIITLETALEQLSNSNRSLLENLNQKP